jgi:hypothetical protein
MGTVPSEGPDPDETTPQPNAHIGANHVIGFSNSSAGGIEERGGTCPFSKPSLSGPPAPPGTTNERLVGRSIKPGDGRADAAEELELITLAPSIGTLRGGVAEAIPTQFHIQTLRAQPEHLSR